MSPPEAPLELAELLAAGRQALDAVLIPAGSTHVAGETGPSSGGPYARAAYVVVERRLDLGVRSRPGLVTHPVGGASLTREELMRAALRGRQESVFPGFEQDPRQAFDFLA